MFFRTRQKIAFFPEKTVILSDKPVFYKTISVRKAFFDDPYLKIHIMTAETARAVKAAPTA